MAEPSSTDPKVSIGISLDVSGAKEVGEAVAEWSKLGVDGARGFFSSLCMPALSELGLLAQDTVVGWRERNAINIALKTKQKLRELGMAGAAHAHPRIVSRVIEEGSLTDDETLQEMWASLLAQSCGDDALSDQNVYLAGILRNLSADQARLIRLAATASLYIGESEDKARHVGKWLPIEILLNELGSSDLRAIDLNLDHLQAIGLLNLGTKLTKNQAVLIITDLGFYLASVCQVSPSLVRSPPRTIESLSPDEAAQIVFPSQIIVA